MKELVLPHTKRNTTAAIANAQAQNELKSERALRNNARRRRRERKKIEKGTRGQQKSIFSGTKRWWW